MSVSISVGIESVLPLLTTSSTICNKSCASPAVPASAPGLDVSCVTPTCSVVPCVIFCTTSDAIFASSLNAATVAACCPAPS